MINHIRKVDIIHGVTPIEKLQRLSDLIGINLYVKRDDCTGLAFGGNKARKLEYLIADAIEQGADTLVTCGGIQSNHARQTAAAAAKFGLDCHLILEPVKGTPHSYYPESGNVLLDHLLGAKITYAENGELDACMDSLIKKLNEDGKKCYVVPMGGSNPVGSLGYVNCGIELSQQLSDMATPIDLIIHATGSAGTQAGLLTGLNMAGCHVPVLGICVSRPASEQEALVWQLCKGIQAHYGFESEVEREQVKANGDYYGDGYGILNKETSAAVKLVAQKEGLLLDPVYSGKAMAGLLDLAKTRQLSGNNLLFLHTGGAPGLFAYQPQLF